ncbi:Protein of unknown function [Sinosporangium album]|uniref:DinB superfamily protein n=1 Tax=Sinosporangium album TaxID=504805 RepID=A0A1G8J270_9ACTN|nr:DinB family protein [Sinosporangium album]SDI25152.1 Protein of unknown function [Sinosporangium album]
MTESVPQTFAQTWPDDTRPPLPDTGDERETLVAFLDHHRQTFELKCLGVPPEHLSDLGVPPSKLSLHGLIRHLADVERWWFRQQFAKEDIPGLYYTEEDPDRDFETLDGDPAEALARWREECAVAREIVARAASLDETCVRFSTGKPISLRRIMVHMIAEYARHNGHADLLRERIDGKTGF